MPHASQQFFRSANLSAHATSDDSIKNKKDTIVTSTVFFMTLLYISLQYKSISKVQSEFLKDI